MMNMQALADIRKASKERVKKIKFHEPITNICAGEGNPTRHAYFVKRVTTSYTNRFGIKHSKYYVKCTDGNGEFWDTSIDVVYPGHLDRETCKELFEPLWQAEYGK